MNPIKENNPMKKIKWILLTLVFILLLAQHLSFGFKAEHMGSIFINTAIEIILLLVTVFIVDRVVKKYYEGIDRKIEEDQYKEVLSTRHNLLVNKLRSLMIHFITKKPSELAVDKDDFEKIINDIDTLVNKKFLLGSYDLLIVDESNVFNTTTRNINYMPFLKYYFKDPMINQISTFTSKYAALLPNEILTSLFKIEDTLKSNYFVALEDHGIDSKIMRTTEDKVSQEFIEKLRYQLKVIGEEINKLDEFMNK